MCISGGGGNYLRRERVFSYFPVISETKEGMAGALSAGGPMCGHSSVWLRTRSFSLISFIFFIFF